MAYSLRAGSEQKCSSVLILLASCMTYTVTCVQWKTADDGQRNSPKHVEFYSKNKFDKLVILVGIIIRIFHDARSPERQTTQVLQHNCITNATAARKILNLYSTRSMHFCIWERNVLSHRHAFNCHIISARLRRTALSCTSRTVLSEHCIHTHAHTRPTAAHRIALLAMHDSYVIRYLGCYSHEHWPSQLWTWWSRHHYGPQG